MHKLTKANLLTAQRLAFAIGILAVSLPGAFAHTEKPHTEKKAISAEMHPWGQEGEAKKVTRTIHNTMGNNMRFTPDAIAVKQGETIRFVVKNNGKVLHEMVIGSKEELEKHAVQMKKHPNMEHDEPYMAHVASAKNVDMLWKFSRLGTFMFACLIPGHFEAGMKGVINVVATTPPKNHKQPYLNH
ncbi:MAG: cupredoxin family protein [Pseudomonadota bacterium]